MSAEPPPTPLRPFHLAIPVTDLESAEAFYCGILGCDTGRKASRWIDLNFFGHQVTLHLVKKLQAATPTNPVDGEAVPARHFGVVLEMTEWENLVDRIHAADCEFLIEPQIRFSGEIGEQATMFLLDPSDNALEFKAFRDAKQLFAG